MLSKPQTLAILRKQAAAAANNASDPDADPATIASAMTQTGRLVLAAMKPMPVNQDRVRRHQRRTD